MAEVYHNNIIDIDLESGTLFRSFLNHTIGSGDNNANWYGVRVFRKGQPIALSGCSVQGLFMPASGSAILISDGTHTWVSGNEAAVLLPQACYNVMGQFTLTIKIIGTNSYSITDTVRIIDGVVADTYSENPVAPTAAVPTYQEILAVYDQMVAAKDGSVRFDIEQELTAAQMTQARGNIAAASESDVSDLKSAYMQNASDSTALYSVVFNASINPIQMKILADGNSKCLYFPCQPNAIYTVSKTAGRRFGIGATATKPASNVSYLNYVEEYTGTVLTIKTPYNAKYLFVWYWHSAYDTISEADMRSSIRVKEHTNLMVTSHITDGVWFPIINGVTASEITLNENGEMLWANTTPSTAAYAGVGNYLGKYANVKDIHCCVEVKGDNATPLFLTIRLSKQASWGGAASPAVVKAFTIPVNGTEFVFFTPSAVLSALGYTDSDDVYFLIEQATKSGNAVSLRISLYQNILATTPLAATSKYTNFAGVEEYRNAEIYRSPSMVSSIGATVSGENGAYKILIPSNTGASGQSYASIAFPIKSFITEGKILRYTLKKKNSATPWTWDPVRLSTQTNNWSPVVLVKVLSSTPGYSASKTYEIDLGALDIDTTQYSGEIYLVFATFINNPVASASDELSFQYSILNEKTVVATDLKGFIQEDYYNKEEIDDIVNDVAPTDEMVFWGDSLTAGAGGGGTTYCTVCANLLGKEYKNYGVGGETEQTIAARQGGNNLIIPAGAVNGTYAFSQMLDGRGKQILPLRQGGTSTVNPVIINGQSCTLSLSDETYTISGYTGSLLFETPALFNGYKSRGDITVIFVGSNGLGSNTVAERISYIKSMLTKVGKKYVIMGLSYGNDENRAADDAAMLDAFGNHFFPTRKMLVKYGLSVAGVSPTSQDTTDISSGTVPTSLRSDHIHLNSNGYTALGKMLAAFIVGLGYASYA